MWATPNTFSPSATWGPNWTFSSVCVFPFRLAIVSVYVCVCVHVCVCMRARVQVKCAHSSAHTSTKIIVQGILVILRARNSLRIYFIEAYEARYKHADCRGLH